MKTVVFMGTPDFAVDTLQALNASEKYEVTGVFTQPDRPKGRGNAVAMSPVKETAIAAGIPVYQPEKIRDDASWEVLQKLAPDFIVVVAFGQLIPKRILDLPRYCCVNVHASLLPKYRGAAPIQWAILDGETETGVTTMRMDPGLDTGDMIRKVTVPIGPEETGGSLFDTLKEKGAGLLLETLDAIVDGTASYEKQPEESPTRYASMLDRKMGKIDWTWPAEKIERYVRGLSPWPSAYTFRNGKTLKIWASEVVSKEQMDGKTILEGAPGTIIYTDRNCLWIAAGDGLLSIRELQPEGKKRMETDAYLRGYPAAAGEMLG